MKTILALVATVAVFATVGAMDYEDAQKDLAYKCEMVESGAWPESVLKRVECDD